MSGPSVTRLKCVIKRVLENSKPIPDFSGYYASRAGNVYLYRQGQLRKIKKTKTKSGHYQVSIRKDGIYKTRYVHKLMYMVFGDEFDLGPTGLLDDIKEGKKPNKISEKEVSEIRKRNKGGESYRKLSMEYKVSHTQIMRICTKDNWKNV